MLPPDFQAWFESNLSGKVQPSSTLEELSALSTTNTPFSSAIQPELEAIRRFLLQQLKRAKQDEQVRLEREREARILDGALSILLEDGLDITGAALVEARERFLATKQNRSPARSPVHDVFETVKPLLGKQEITLPELQRLGIDTQLPSVFKPLRDYLYRAGGYKVIQFRGERLFRLPEPTVQKLPSGPKPPKAGKRKGKGTGPGERIPDEDVIKMRNLYYWQGYSLGVIAGMFHTDNVSLVRKFCLNERRETVPFPRQDGSLRVLPKGPHSWEEIHRLLAK